jgi:protein phosphatase
MKFAAISDIGKVRKVNEDCFYVPEDSDKIKLFLIADGIGGQNHGKFAGMMTVENVVRNIYKDSDNQDKKLMLKKAIRGANNKIIKHSSENEEFKGMGSTLVALLVENELAYITHAGDSRCYMIRNNFISQITVDNSYVEYLLQKGVISAEEAKNHPQKNLIIKAIGMDKDLDLDFEIIDIKPGDIFLLCSDGLTSMVSDEEMLHIIIKRKKDLQKAVDELIKVAKRMGGKDNITAILVEV